MFTGVCGCSVWLSLDDKVKRFLKYMFDIFQIYYINMNYLCGRFKKK